MPLFFCSFLFKNRTFLLYKKLPKRLFLFGIFFIIEIINFVDFLDLIDFINFVINEYYKFK